MYTRILDRTIEISEAIVYVGIAIMLTITAIALLVLAVRNVLPLFGDDASNVALDVLDTLLLVFIVVELLFAVRATISQRELLAEPFLLAGIIASIKEIIVLSVKAAETVGQGSAFRDQMWEIGTLGVLVLLLAVAAFLLRRKEREPDEGDKQEKV
ncbi:MAG: phosphate-starvation-inducible PsiE family protein [Geodermatophilaceae bacterium]|nr:phosphate-starvation-inducible PsiE family protein [Geodermatophilaceae bacterium]